MHAFAAPKFVELAPSPRNAETVGSASRDAKTVTMAHELARSFALWCPGSSATGVHLLATSRRDFVLTKAVDGVGAPIEAAGPRALAAKQRTARLGAKTHSRGPRCLRCRLGQPNDAHFKRQKLLKTLKNHIRQKCPFRSQWWIIRDRFNDLSWFSGRFYLDLVPSLIFQREAARMHQTLHATHYFSIRKLRLSESLPPFGRRVALRSIAPNLPTPTNCA